MLVISVVRSALLHRLGQADAGQPHEPALWPAGRGAGGRCRARVQPGHGRRRRDPAPARDDEPGAARHRLHEHVRDAALSTWPYFFVLINVSLFIFNLLPIPPLDGWQVLLGLVDARTAWHAAPVRGSTRDHPARLPACSSAARDHRADHRLPDRPPRARSRVHPPRAVSGTAAGGPARSASSCATWSGASPSPSARPHGLADAATARAVRRDAPADQRHGLDVVARSAPRVTPTRTCCSPACCTTAGKGHGVGLWHRVALVARASATATASVRLSGRLPGFRRAFDRIATTPSGRRELALAAGCTERTADLIRHQAEPVDAAHGRGSPSGRRGGASDDGAGPAATARLCARGCGRAGRRRSARPDRRDARAHSRRSTGRWRCCCRSSSSASSTSWRSPWATSPAAYLEALARSSEQRCRTSARSSACARSSS